MPQTMTATATAQEAEDPGALVATLVAGAFAAALDMAEAQQLTEEPARAPQTVTAAATAQEAEDLGALVATLVDGAFAAALEMAETQQLVRQFALRRVELRGERGEGLRTLFDGLKEKRCGIRDPGSGMLTLGLALCGAGIWDPSTCPAGACERDTASPLLNPTRQGLCR